jgi:Holliday junction resolvase RusA-like endonuclease
MIELVIPGVPVSQKRPKVTRKGTYNPSKKEQECAKIILTSQWYAELIRSPIHIEVKFLMPIPKSFSKKQQQKVIGEPHHSKPDIDNLLAFLFNAMSGIVYLDDRQIWNLQVSKIYSIDPCTNICIK